MDVITTIQKLISLAGNNPNEHERTAAALKACELIRENQFAISSSKYDYSKIHIEPDFSPMKEFWTKIVMINGSPRTKTLSNNDRARCSICKERLPIQPDTIVFIPNTLHMFHAQCWVDLKISVKP